MKTLTLTLALFGLFVNMQSQVIEYTYDAAGNRTQRRVIVLKKNYTDDTDSSKQEVVQEQLGEWQFNMYPNPVKEQLTISIKEKGESIKDSWQSAVIEVYDLSGRLIEKRVHLEESNVIDFSQQNAGAFIVRIVIDKQQKEWKVVKY